MVISDHPSPPCDASHIRGAAGWSLTPLIDQHITPPDARHIGRRREVALESGRVLGAELGVIVTKRNDVGARVSESFGHRGEHAGFIDRHDPSRGLVGDGDCCGVVRSRHHND